VRIHEGTTVTGDRPLARTPRLLHTERGRVSARQVLLAGNVYLQRRRTPARASHHAGGHVHCLQRGPWTRRLGRRQVIPSGSAVCDNNFVLDYFRFADDHRMLYGGRVSYSTATPA
jgi:gamma-glutamylputrescine oxidase